MTTYEDRGIAEHRYRVGQCPGCRDYIWADVIVDTVIKKPWLKEDGTAVANVDAKIVKVSLAHECAGRVSSE